MILVTSYYLSVVQLYLQNCDSFSFTYCSRQPPLTLPKIPCLQFRNFSLEQLNHDEVYTEFEKIAYLSQHSTSLGSSLRPNINSAGAIPVIVCGVVRKANNVFELRDPDTFFFRPVFTTYTALSAKPLEDG